MSKSKYNSIAKTTSNTDKYNNKLTTLQRQFKNEIKLTITEYAGNARNELYKNIKIKENISRSKYISELFKKLFVDIMQKKGTKQDICKLFIEFNNIFKEDNKVLKTEILEEYKKLKKYQNEVNKEIKPLQEKINQLKATNFILQNKIIYYDNITENIKNLIPKNDIEHNINKDEINIEEDDNKKFFDEFLIVISKIYQEALLSSLKDLNKLKNRNNKKLEKINYCRKILDNKGHNIININLLENINLYNNMNNNEEEENNLDNNENNTILSFKEFDITLASLGNLEKEIEENNIKINGDIYNLPQKNLSKSNIREILINNDDIKNNKNNKRVFSVDHKKIDKKDYDTKNTKKNKGIELPKLNLNQINFNKNNKNYNLSSNLRKNKTPENSNNRNGTKSSEEKISRKKDLKEKIKEMKNNITKNKKIIDDFKQFCSVIMDKYEKFIYGPEIENYVLTTENNFSELNE